MTNLEMLELIGNVKDGYIAQAQTHRVKKKPQETTRRSPSKLILIAATMVFLLTGCAYAVMKLQDLKVAEDSYTKSRDVYGNLIEPTEVTEDVIYPYAPAESPMQQAAREWHEYRESPDTPTQEDGRVPMNYYHTYHCANREMMAKLDEITEKYGLKLLETELLIQSYQKDILHEALGIQSVIRADAKAQVQEHYGGAYPNGTFTSSVFFTLEGEDAWELESFADFYYAAEGYFYPYYTYVTEDCQEWTYQTADGTTVLMVMYPDGRGKVFADGVGGSIMIDLDPVTWPRRPTPGMRMTCLQKQIWNRWQTCLIIR